MRNWQCICGRVVDGKRYCPTCSRVAFRMERNEFLAYDGMSVGFTYRRHPFFFPPDLLPSHVLVSGQTGTGKTRFAMKLATESCNCSVASPPKLLAVDVEGEWKNVIPHLSGKTEHYSIDRNLKINPFDLNDPALIRELMRETVFKGIEKEYQDLSAQMSFVLQKDNAPELQGTVRTKKGTYRVVLWGNGSEEGDL